MLAEIRKRIGDAPQDDIGRAKWVEEAATIMWHLTYGDLPVEEEDHACGACRDSGWRRTDRPGKTPTYAHCRCRHNAVDTAPAAAMCFPAFNELPTGADIDRPLWAKIKDISLGDSLFLYGPASKLLKSGYIIAETIRRKWGKLPRYVSAHSFPAKNVDHFLKWQADIMAVDVLIIDGVCRGLDASQLRRVAELLEHAARSATRKTIILMGESVPEGAGYPVDVWSRIHRAMEPIMKIRWRVS